MRHAALTILLILAAPAAFAAVSAADRSFLDREARGISYELAIAQLAVQKATRNDIKAYAQRIIAEHAQEDAMLKQIAQNQGVSLPAGMTHDEQTRFADLQGLQGAAFDRAYVAEMVRASAEDERDLTEGAQGSHDLGIRAYANRFGAVAAEHEHAARQLRASS